MTNLISRSPLHFLTLTRAFLCVATLHFPSVAAQGFDDYFLPIPSSNFTPPPPPKKVPAMVVKSSSVLKLPTHQITILRGEASTLPDIPVPPVAKPSRMGPIDEPQYLVSIGATVYDHQISHVRWWNPKTRETFEAWCGWDWTLLSPLPQIEIGNQLSHFHLTSFNIDTAVKVRLGRKLEILAHPEVAPDGFVITKGNSGDPSAMAILGTLRDCYIKHKPRLILIQKAQEQYKAEAAAWHAAHPPKPESHTYWLKPHRGSRYLSKNGGGR